MKLKVSLFTILFLSFPSIILGAESNHSTDMVISFDGMRHDFLEEYMEQQQLPHFKQVVSRGKMADNIRTIFPSLTSASHAAIATGAASGATGMVSNELHKPNKKLTDSESAFYSGLDAKPLWSVVRKEGKKTATILFPGSNPKYGHQADYSIYYGNTLAESELISLGFKKNTKERQSAVFPLKIGNGHNLKVYVTTETPGEFYLSFDRNMQNKEKVSLDEWGSLSFQTHDKEMAGFAFKIKATKPDLSDAKLYRTAVSSGVVKGPKHFKEDIYKHFGYFPIQEDDKALDKKWITRKEYEEISIRFAQWTTDVSLYIKKKYKPDLLFFYYPQIDHESHKYLLSDPRQPGYTSDRSKQYLSYIRWSYKLADEMLGQVLAETGQDDRLFIVSDHGMEPVHSRLSPNEELEKKGLLVKYNNGKVNIKKSKAFAVASGSIAHVYINLKGREEGGIVDQTQYDKIQKEIADIFKGVEVDEKKIPLTTFFSIAPIQLWGKIVHNNEKLPGSFNSFTKTAKMTFFHKKIHPYDKVILTGTDNSYEKGQIQHPNAGDIILVAQKGYYMAQGSGDEVMEPGDLGNHGGNPSRKELRPVFLAVGKGIKKGTIDTKISTLDIAPTLYQLIGIQPPDFVEGKAIGELTEKAERKVQQRD
ncbi:alkaline phosphatase family protein [Neobacillus kokaensis]|uniref:Nucleotide pyrophosphatase n=1 Tax=Neobacillus kokaensis TaxID=2759023 RepID=A0ABQ3N7W4_9BACI|nr:alkaline phosphatase family protein [Neobacillus kokaensis]GHH99682.1 hypothetical protein AM1BK_32250 [Neobacillus kokaensis]